jgi:hypothetical protein
MDPTTLIVAALTAGVTAGFAESASGAAKDAYLRLLRAIRLRFNDTPSAVESLEGHASDPEAWRVALARNVEVTGATQDGDIIEAAQRLLEAVDASGSKAGKYVVNISGGQGAVVGDNARVIQSFNQPPSA